MIYFLQGKGIVMTRKELVEVFNETRNLSLSMFKAETDNTVENTDVIIDGSIFLKDCKTRDQKIEVVKGRTVQTALGVDGGRIAVLNFADPFTKGGLVLQGEYTQEECLCRCSNLYEALSKQKCSSQYYRFNSDYADCSIFSDRLIYSKDVLFFRDEDYSILKQPVKLDVITSPAPVCCSDIGVFERRIRCIIGSANSNGVDTIVLGAWGCGAFGNNPNVVAEAFKNVLERYKIFDKVIFAIRCTDDKPSDNYETFKKVLG